MGARTPLRRSEPSVERKLGGYDVRGLTAVTWPRLLFVE